MNQESQVATVSGAPTKDPKSFLATVWAEKLTNEFTKPYMNLLRSFLSEELKNGFVFFPKSENIFRALRECDFDSVKVVIIGQDPYHGLGQASGLCFGVEPPTPPPPSLQNILKELIANYPNQIKKTDSGKYKFDWTLDHWAKQGVLLLNSVLTVRENQAFSHRDKGWEQFTDKVIESLNAKKTPVVFLCWGSAATKKVEKINNPLHLILKSAHPSPLSAHRGFLGNGHFKKTNEFLKKMDLKEINWFEKPSA